MEGLHSFQAEGRAWPQFWGVAGRRVWLKLYEKREQSSGRVPGVGVREDNPLYLCETGSCGETGAEVGNDLTSVRSVLPGRRRAGKGEEGWKRSARLLVWTAPQVQKERDIIEDLEGLPRT